MFSFVFFTACGGESSTDKYPIMPAPVIGGYSGNDISDHDCSIVLLDVGRRTNGMGGYIDDGHSYIWFGTLDVAQTALSGGGTPKIAFHSGLAGEWYEASCLPVEGARSGFQRCEFELGGYLPGPGMSGTALSRSIVELIPFIHLSNGDRLFDHNRNGGDFDNYLLTLDNNWSIASEPLICSLVETNPAFDAEEARPAAVLNFNGDYTTTVSGNLVEGGTVEINYVLDRLATCRGTHNGYPAWDLRAFARFLPGGEVVEGSVRDFVSNMGTPTTESFAVPVSFNVPAGARTMEVWFWNSTLGGAECQDWDSNNGDNYAFPVMSGPGWMGNYFLNISRASSVPCADGSSLGDSFDYGTWARQRAIAGNVCFEVWQEGITDQGNPDLWQILDVRVWYRFNGEDFQDEYVDFVDYKGNNARYAFNIAALDPFRPYNCPEMETEEVTYVSGEVFETAQMEFLFTVNGVMAGPESGTWFTGTFEDYADNTFRDTSCP
ncbi:hypothetical protein KKF84_16965 [Myxococcota bacterium]|nr:hypothetical protein [Myxococcota bacterium]